MNAREKQSVDRCEFILAEIETYISKSIKLTRTMNGQHYDFGNIGMDSLMLTNSLQAVNSLLIEYEDQVGRGNDFKDLLRQLDERFIVKLSRDVSKFYLEVTGDSVRATNYGKFLMKHRMKRPIRK